MCQPLDVLLQALPLPALEDVDDTGVERPPLRGQKAPVRDLVGQRVLERVFELGRRACLVEKLGALEPSKVFAKTLVGGLQDHLDRRNGSVRPMTAAA